MDMISPMARNKGNPSLRKERTTTNRRSTLILHSFARSDQRGPTAFLFHLLLFSRLRPSFSDFHSQLTYSTLCTPYGVRSIQPVTGHTRLGLPPSSPHHPQFPIPGWNPTTQFPPTFPGPLATQPKSPNRFTTRQTTYSLSRLGNLFLVHELINRMSGRDQSHHLVPNQQRFVTGKLQ